jgi:hypothetical protein
MRTQLKIGAAILLVLFPTSVYYDLPEMGACLFIGLAFVTVGLANLRSV